MSRESPVAEFVVDAGEEPVEISLTVEGVLRWITAMPEAAARR